MRYVLYKASAGTGKTEKLKDEFIATYIYALFKNSNFFTEYFENSKTEKVFFENLELKLYIYPGILIQRIIALTFTNEAVAEMKDRIYSGMERVFSFDIFSNERFISNLTKIFNEFSQRKNKKVENWIVKIFVKKLRMYKEQIIDSLDYAKIMTIHSFSFNILNQFSIDIGLNPEMIVETSDEFFYEFFNKYIEDILSNKNSKYSEYFSILLSLIDFNELLLILKSEFKKLVNFSPIKIEKIINYYKGCNDEMIANKLIDEVNKFIKEYQSMIKEQFKINEIKSLLNLESLIEIKKDSKLGKFFLLKRKLGSKKITNFLQSIEFLINLEEMYNEEIKFRKNKDKFIIYLSNLLNFLKSTGEVFSDKITFENSKDNQLLNRFKLIILLFNDYLYLIFFEIFKNFFNSYLEEKFKTGIINFSDMENFFLLSLLGKSEAGFNRLKPLDIEELFKDFDEVFFLIDELQDISEIQYHIFKKLIFDNKDNKRISVHFFGVGDPKQSIYSFRETSPKYINEIENILEKLKKEEKQNLKNQELFVDLKTLDICYRSEKPLLDSINFIFENFKYFFTSNEEIFQEDVKFQYNSLKPYIKNKSEKINNNTFVLPSGIYFKNFNTYLTKDNLFYERDLEKLLEDLANLIKYLVNSENETEYRDFLIILRKKEYFTRIKSIFDKYDIPVNISSSVDDLLNNPVVKEILKFLKSIEFNDSEYFLIAFLKSSFIQLNDKDIYEILNYVKQYYTKDDFQENNIKHYEIYQMYQNHLINFLKDLIEENKKVINNFNSVVDSQLYNKLKKSIDIIKFYFELVKIKDQLMVSEIVQLILEKTGLLKGFTFYNQLSEKDKSKNTIFNSLNYVNLKLFLNGLRKLERDLDLSLYDFIYGLETERFKDYFLSSPTDPIDNAVKVMTIHSSKGLGEKNVIFIDVEKTKSNNYDNIYYNYEVFEDIANEEKFNLLTFLNQSSKNYYENINKKIVYFYKYLNNKFTKNIFKKYIEYRKKEEELEKLRLFYVAFTRAKKRLFYIYSKDVNGKKKNLTKGLGKDFIEKILDEINKTDINNEILSIKPIDLKDENLNFDFSSFIKNITKDINLKTIDTKKENYFDRLILIDSSEIIKNSKKDRFQIGVSVTYLMNVFNLLYKKTGVKNYNKLFFQSESETDTIEEKEEGILVHTFFENFIYEIIEKNTVEINIIKDFLKNKINKIFKYKEDKTDKEMSEIITKIFLSCKRLNNLFKRLNININNKIFTEFNFSSSFIIEELNLIIKINSIIDLFIPEKLFLLDYKFSEKVKEKPDYQLQILFYYFLILNSEFFISKSNDKLAEPLLYIFDIKRNEEFQVKLYKLIDIINKLIGNYSDFDTYLKFVDLNFGFSEFFKGLNKSNNILDKNFYIKLKQLFYSLKNLEKSFNNNIDRNLLLSVEKDVFKTFLEFLVLNYLFIYTKLD